MKNRAIKHSDHWATPPFFYNKLRTIYNFDFDPCPYQHDLNEWDGLEVEWGQRNFVNPGYSKHCKTDFVEKAYEESVKGKFCLLLLPVSTSTDLYHDLIKTKAQSIIFLKKRIPFIGINTKDQYVNWHLWDRQAPEGVVHVKSLGQQDSMLVIFNGLF